LFSKFISTSFVFLPPILNSGFDDKAIKEGMKRIGIKYDSNLSKTGRNIFGKSYKGGFEGCYYKEFNDE
jgi:hypothetical protein